MSLTKGTLQSNRVDLKVCDRAYGELFLQYPPLLKICGGYGSNFFYMPIFSE